MHNQLNTSQEFSGILNKLEVLLVSYKDESKRLKKQHKKEIQALELKSERKVKEQMAAMDTQLNEMSFKFELLEK